MTIRGVGSLSIAVPANLRGGPQQGIDSLVAEYRGAGLRLSLDFGMYGARPDCSTYRCASIEIDGLPAAMARAERIPAADGRTAPGHWRHFYVALPGPGQAAAINLVIYAHCATADRCTLAERIFRTIDFNLTPAPGAPR